MSLKFQIAPLKPIDFARGRYWSNLSLRIYLFVGVFLGWPVACGLVIGVSSIAIGLDRLIFLGLTMPERALLMLLVHAVCWLVLLLLFFTPWGLFRAYRSLRQSVFQQAGFDKSVISTFGGPQWHVRHLDGRLCEAVAFRSVICDGLAVFLAADHRADFVITQQEPKKSTSPWVIELAGRQHSPGKGFVDTEHKEYPGLRVYGGEEGARALLDVGEALDLVQRVVDSPPLGGQLHLHFAPGAVVLRVVLDDLHQLTEQHLEQFLDVLLQLAAFVEEAMPPKRRGTPHTSFQLLPPWAMRLSFAFFVVLWACLPVGVAAICFFFAAISVLL
ncbi:MAG: hypothetical protein HN348_12635 [Proteobacteria bacterium]|jgi:hypothetical protein|nr:hypothetical protein [Pseudomonadota bacterium]